MARKKLETKTSLSELISEWGKNKSECDSLTKLVKRDAATIKDIMISEKLTESTSGKYIAKLSFQHKEQFDEEGLLNYIKTNLWGDKGSMECPYIKRVEVIDWEAIESAIYNENITPDQLLEIDKFKETNEVPVLKLAIVKEE